MARPTPVLPEVASTIVPPGFSRPDCSASVMILSPMRSFIEPPGLKNSTFAYNGQAICAAIRFNRTSGVLPIVSKMLSWTRNDSEVTDEDVDILYSCVELRYKDGKQKPPRRAA